MISNLKFFSEKYMYSVFITALFFIFLIPADLNALFLLEGGLGLESGKFIEKADSASKLSGKRKDEEINILNTSIWGGMDIGFEPGSFGVNMSSELYFLGSADSKLYGPLNITELFLRTQLKYNTPVKLPFAWAKRSKVNYILAGINPWIGLGPILVKTINKDISKTGESYESVPDLMDFGMAFTIGFHINFWKHLGHSSKFLKKMMAKTYITFDFTYLRILTPDDENTAADNAGDISRRDLIFRLGSALSFDFSKKKHKTAVLK